MASTTTQLWCQIEKTVQCSKQQWKSVFAVMRDMHIGNAFPPEVAALVNKTLGNTPILRERVSEDDHPDMLQSDPSTINNQAADGDVQFVISSWAPVQLELIGMTMRKDGAGANEGDIEGKIVSDVLKVQIACMQKQGREIMSKPQEGLKFATEDLVWCQLKRRRFWNMHLVISKDVAKNGFLVDDHILVDATLKGNSQYLLMPAVRRRYSAGMVIPRLHQTLTLDQLNVADDMSPVVISNLIAFFQGIDAATGDMTIQLRNYPVHVHNSQIQFSTENEQRVPLVFCGEKYFEKGKINLQEGVLYSSDDLHGNHPRLDVQGCVGLKRIKQIEQSGLHIAGVMHKTRPKAWNVPERACFDSGFWWEAPITHTTVLEADSTILILPNTPNQECEPSSVHLESMVEDRLLSRMACEGNWSGRSSALSSVWPPTAWECQESIDWAACQWGAGSWYQCNWSQGSLSYKPSNQCRTRQHDKWSQLHVQELLNQLAQFERVDESWSGKLGQSGRGMWRLVHRNCNDITAIEADMFSSFLTADIPYKKRKVHLWAIFAGKHELLQKMLALGNTEQKKRLVSQFDGLVKYLLKNEFGCLLLQQLMFEALHEMGQLAKIVVDVMKNDMHDPETIQDSSMDPHGNHVMQKLIGLLQKLPEENQFLQRITQDVSNDVVAMGTNQHGCRVIIKLLDKPMQDLTDECQHHFLQKVVEKTTTLVTSEYGNHVMNAIVNSKRPDYHEAQVAIFQHVVDNCSAQCSSSSGGGGFFYPAHRFARHVMVNCLIKDTPSRVWIRLRNQLQQILMDREGNPKFPLQFTTDVLDALKYGSKSNLKSRANKRSKSSAHRHAR